MPFSDAFWEAADAEAEFGVTAGLPWRRPETLEKRLDVLRACGVVTPGEYEMIRLRVLALESAATVVPSSAAPSPDAAPCSPATKS